MSALSSVALASGLLLPYLSVNYELLLLFSEFFIHFIHDSGGIVIAIIDPITKLLHCASLYISRANIFFCNGCE